MLPWRSAAELVEALADLNLVCVHNHKVHENHTDRPACFAHSLIIEEGACPPDVGQPTGPDGPVFIKLPQLLLTQVVQLSIYLLPAISMPYAHGCAALQRSRDVSAPTAGGCVLQLMAGRHMVCDMAMQGAGPQQQPAGWHLVFGAGDAVCSWQLRGRSTQLADAADLAGCRRLCAGVDREDTCKRTGMQEGLTRLPKWREIRSLSSPVRLSYSCSSKSATCRQNTVTSLSHCRCCRLLACCPQTLANSSRLQWHDIHFMHSAKTDRHSKAESSRQLDTAMPAGHAQRRPQPLCKAKLAGLHAAKLAHDQQS